jgi:hypothetical protein
MNKIYTFQKAFLFIALSVFACSAKAQTPTYLLKITNEQQTSPQDYLYDIFLLQTGSNPFELANTGIGIGFDTSILNGGDPTFTIVSPGSAYSELNAAQQPLNVGPGTGVSTGTRNVGGVNYRFMNVLPRPGPGVGNGTIITNIDSGCGHPGTRVGRFQLHNSIPFRAGSSCKHVFSTAIGSGSIPNTTVSAYVGGLATTITNTASNQSYAAGQVPPTCTQNILLNAATLVSENPFLSSGLNVYPNPALASGKLNVFFNFSVNKKYTLKVMDLLGKIMTEQTGIAQEEKNVHEVDLDGFEKGFYLLSVGSEGAKTETKRIVIQ